MAADLKSKLQPYIDQLDSELHKKNKVTDVLAQAEQATGIKRINFVLGGIALVALVFIFTFGSELLINIVAFAYPAWRYEVSRLVHNVFDTFFFNFELFSHFRSHLPIKITYQLEVLREQLPLKLLLALTGAALHFFRKLRNSKKTSWKLSVLR